MAKTYTAEQKFFQWILKIYVWLLAKAYGLEEFPEIECTYNHKQEITIMSNFILKDDNPPFGLQLQLGEVKDAEGQVIANPSGLSKSIASTDPSVLVVTDNGDGSAQVSVGAPGQASLQYEVKNEAGKVLGSGSDGFTITTGDPDSIASVTAAFDGITPVEEAPVEEPTTGAGEGGTEGGGNA